MPCRRPVWLVAGVWLSMCASIHTRPRSALVRAPRRSTSSRAGMVAADHARQPTAPARAATAPASSRHSLLTANALRRSPAGAEDRAHARRDPARLEPRGQQRREHRGRLGAARIGAAQASRRADQLHLSLHRYCALEKTTPWYERLQCPGGPIA